jgi:hypothetical protein
MRFRSTLALSMLALLCVEAAGGAVAQDLPEGVIEFTPSDVKWSPRPGAQSGLEQAELLGSQEKAGPYTVRLRFPAGYKGALHTHPDSKQYTIISGTWCIGYGGTADSAKLKCLPAGSFYTEPANTPHYVEARDAVVVQVSGSGPSGTTAVNPEPKKN